MFPQLNTKTKQMTESELIKKSEFRVVEYSIATIAGVEADKLIGRYTEAYFLKKYNSTAFAVGAIAFGLYSGRKMLLAFGMGAVANEVLSFVGI